jgi:sugar phosphate permease
MRVHFLTDTRAGFFPGAVYLISTWYLPNETQVRIALFYTSSALAGAFSGLLAFGITKMDGLGGIAGWRWIFIVEGAISVLVGILCYFIMVDTPELSTRWLKPDEIRYLVLRKQAQAGNSPRIRRAEENRKLHIFWSVLTDWQIYVQTLVIWSTGIPNIGLKFTMPQIIKNMGFTSSKAQLLTMPPYLIGALSAYLSALGADKYTWRMPFIVSAQLLVVIAFAILFAKAAEIKNNIGTCYFAVTLACIGLYPITPGANAWTVSNLAGPTKRAQGVAYLVSLGNIGGLIGSYIYIEKEKPKYPTGFGVSLGVAAVGIFACIILESVYALTNKRRQQMTEQDIQEKYSQEQLDEMGDKSPLFRYAL